MRTGVMVVALLAALVPLDEAAGQKSCEASCSGNASCLKRCVSAQKQAPPARQRQAAPKPSSGSSSDTSWRERAFTNDGGAGGY